MMRVLLTAIVLALGTGMPVSAQSLDDLDLQIHGYATQGFVYTTQNNILTTKSSNGSPAWTEAVLNVGVNPIPRLHIGVQGRYFLLGNYGNDVTLDWAAADYKFDDRFGVRFGKVKTPSSLFNEIQDIDPAYMWSLLPQSNYPIFSRDFILAHYGGVIYGVASLGERWGKVEYRAWGGESVIPRNDGLLLGETEAGINLPNGLSGPTYGGSLHWKTPLDGLMLGASMSRNTAWRSKIIFGGLSGTQTTWAFSVPAFYGKYEVGKTLLAAEYERVPPNGTLNFTGLSPLPGSSDYRNWYAMASYKVTGKLTTGLYQCQHFDLKVPLGPPRFSKDWALSARYDFNQYIYAKAEQHFIDGTSQLFDQDLNPNGLKPDTRLTILKIGVSF